MDILLQYFTDFTPQQLEQFAALQTAYNEWNEKINVISRKDIQSLYEKHVLHSLSIAAVAGFKDGMRVIDIGTGGGFPGVPLAIFFPDVQFLLVDSIGKKLKVVEAVCDIANIRNITTVHGRAEEIKDKKFDFAVSRAVAPLGQLWMWAKPLLKKGSEGEIKNGLICLKGGDLAQEISDSGLRPNIVPVSQLFKEPYFEEKFLLHVSV